MQPPVDYSKGYPPHPRPLPYRYNRELVARGYQDHPCIHDKIAAIAQNDAHKKPYFHPGHHGVPVPRRGKRAQPKGCSCAITHPRN